MKYLAFKLSMPGKGSWNGKWSAEGELFCIIEKITENRWRANKDFYEKLIKSYHSYDFGDGWVAAINVALVSEKEARRLKKESKGFYGYSWMVKSLLEKGKIVLKRELE